VIFGSVGHSAGGDDVFHILNSKQLLRMSIVLFCLGLVGWLGFGLQVYSNKINEIMIKDGITDTKIIDFQKFDCPWALMPGETGVVTAVLPYSESYSSIRFTGTRLNVNPIIPPSGKSQEFKWQITALGGGSGELAVDAPAYLDRSLPESKLYWGSDYRQACSILVSVLGLPYQLYLLLCLVLTVAGIGAFFIWAAGMKKKP
jgi:hypothetical protein